MKTEGYHELKNSVRRQIAEVRHQREKAELQLALAVAIVVAIPVAVVVGFLLFGV